MLMGKLYDKGLMITYALVASLLIIFGVLMYSLLSEFEPMSLNDVEMVPEKVCPTELVAADAELKIDEGNYVFTVDPVWTNVDDGRYWDIAQAEFPIDGPIDTSNGVSDVVYEAPGEPGMWLFTVRVELVGRKGILPRKQELTVPAERATEVIDCGEAYTYEEFKRTGG